MGVSLRSASSRIVRACGHLAALGFAPAADGNISVRTGSGTIAITASGSRFRGLTMSQVVNVRLDHTGVRGRTRPSSELPLHAALYRGSSSIGAVVHCHPPYATAFACSGVSLTPNVFPEVILDLGTVPLIRYSMPSGERLGKSVARYAGSAGGALLANHGAVTWGETLDEAVGRMEKLEHISIIELRARQLGGLRQLSTEDVSELVSSHPLSKQGGS